MFGELKDRSLRSLSRISPAAGFLVAGAIVAGIGLVNETQNWIPPEVTSHTLLLPHRIHVPRWQMIRHAQLIINDRLTSPDRFNTSDVADKALRSSGVADIAFRGILAGIARHEGLPVAAITGYDIANCRFSVISNDVSDVNEDGSNTRLDPDISVGISCSHYPPSDETNSLQVIDPDPVQIPVQYNNTVLGGFTVSRWSEVLGMPDADLSAKQLQVIRENI